MSGGFFSTVFFQPLYNGLVFLMDVIPWVDAGVAVVLFTIIVKLILFPLSKKAARTQILMRHLDPQLQEIKEKYKDDKQEQAVQTMAFYKENKINPFSSIILLIIQLPIIFALYRVFLSGFPVIQTDFLYSFVGNPANVKIMFLGLIDISGKSIVLAVVAAITSFIQSQITIPPHKPSGAGGFKDDLAKSMNVQMRYIFPVIVFFIAYSISGAIALYWATSNLFMIGQELYMKKHIKNLHRD